MIYTISTGFAIYFVMWWIVLFLTLPFGVRSQQEDGDVVQSSDHDCPFKVGLATRQASSIPGRGGRG